MILFNRALQACLQIGRGPLSKMFQNQRLAALKNFFCWYYQYQCIGIHIDLDSGAGHPNARPPPLQGFGIFIAFISKSKEKIIVVGQNKDKNCVFMFYPLKRRVMYSTCNETVHGLKKHSVYILQWVCTLVPPPHFDRHLLDRSKCVWGGEELKYTTTVNVNSQKHWQIRN